MSGRRTRRLAAIWFADLVGYTELAGRDEDGALAIVDELQRLAREAVSARDGRVVKFVGDAVVAVFDSIEGATASASGLQQAFSASSVASARKATLRFGVHLGEIVEAPDGDIYGDGVNLASRIQSVALPGQILLSEDVFKQLRRRGIRVAHVGTFALKDVEDPQELYALDFGEATAPLEAPAEPTADLSRRPPSVGATRPGHAPRAFVAGAAALAVLIAVSVVFTDAQRSLAPTGPQTVPPDTAPSARRQAAGQPPFSLTLTHVNPPSVDIALPDGRVIGQTPTTLEFDWGPVELTVGSTRVCARPLERSSTGEVEAYTALGEGRQGGDMHYVSRTTGVEECAVMRRSWELVRPIGPSREAAEYAASIGLPDVPYAITVIDDYNCVIRMESKRFAEPPDTASTWCRRFNGVNEGEFATDAWRARYALRVGLLEDTLVLGDITSGHALFYVARGQ